MEGYLRLNEPGTTCAHDFCVDYNAGMGTDAGPNVGLLERLELQ